MNRPDHSKYIEEFKEFAKKVNASKENAEAFFQSAGIITAKGNLTRNYFHTLKRKSLKTGNK